MKILSCAFTIILCIAPVSAYANTWFALVTSKAQCELLPADGVVGPEAMLHNLRILGENPSIDISKNPDGTISTVDIYFTLPGRTLPAGGNLVDIFYSTNMNDCQIKLQKEISDGYITNPTNSR